MARRTVDLHAFRLHYDFDARPIAETGRFSHPGLVVSLRGQHRFRVGALLGGVDEQVAHAPVRRPRGGRIKARTKARAEMNLLTVNKVNKL